MRYLILIIAGAALLIAASLPLTQWTNNNLSPVGDDRTRAAYDAVSYPFAAGSAAFLAVLGAFAHQLGLRAWRAGLVAVAMTALSYAAAVPIRRSLFPGEEWQVVLPGGPMTSSLAGEPVVAAAVFALAAPFAFVITTSAAWLWGRLRARTA
jgi:hypothetical protein